MPTRKRTAGETPPDNGDVLRDAAKAIGSALGKLARKTGIAHADGAPTVPGVPPKASGKLVKKAKKRLPRKLKKQARRAPQS